MELPFFLLEEPVQVVAALRALSLVPGEERNLTDVLEDAVGGAGDLLTRGPASAERVGELVAAKGEDVVVEVVVLAVTRLVQGYAQGFAVEEVPGHLVLDGGHDLKLGAATAAAGAEDGEDLLDLGAVGPGVFALVLLLLGEEHEGAPLVLHVAEHLTAAAHDVADAIHRDHDDGQIVPTHGVVDVHRSGALGEDVPDVVLGALARGGCPGDLDLRPLHPRRRARGFEVDDLELGARDSRDLALGGAALAEDEGGVVVGDLYDIRGGIALAFLPSGGVLRRGVGRGAGGSGQTGHSARGIGPIPRNKSRKPEARAARSRAASPNPAPPTASSGSRCPRGASVCRRSRRADRSRTFRSGDLPSRGDRCGRRSSSSSSIARGGEPFASDIASRLSLRLARGEPRGTALERVLRRC